MIKVTVPSETTIEKAEEIQDFLDKTAMRDVNFNGAEFHIVHGDCLSVEPENDATARLHYQINNILFGFDEEE